MAPETFTRRANAEANVRRARSGQARRLLTGASCGGAGEGSRRAHGETTLRGKVLQKLCGLRRLLRCLR
jgi:hypothetical protein